MKPIPRVDKVENEHEPAILVGRAKQMPAFTRWNRDYLTNLIGGIDVPYKQSSCHKHPDFGADSIPKMFARGKSTFGEFLQKLSSPTVLFTGDEQFLMRKRDGVESIDPSLAPLLDDLEILCPRDRLYSVWAWFSGKGVRTWLHYDTNGCHNYNAQLTGSKECVLIPPEELARVHPFVLGAGNPATNCSQIDVEDVAPQFKDYDTATKWEGKLVAGDVLYIPAWWSHTFKHLGELNCNVNFWWKPERPVANVTAIRQGFLDAVAKAGVKDPVLQKLDEAAISL